MNEKTQVSAISGEAPAQAPTLQQILAQAAARGIPDLAAAYVRAWGEIPNVVKNANNPHFGNDYADLAAVIDTIKPIFAKHGLALLQFPGVMRDEMITMGGVLMHVSGQHINFTTELPIGNKPTAQAAGSAHTYARRYQAMAVGGLAPVDDDGEAASEPPPPQTKRPKKVDEREQAEKPAKANASTKEPEEPIASKAQSLIDRIGAAETVAQLEALKQETLDLNDRPVADIYVSKLKELKKAAKAATGGAK